MSSVFFVGIAKTYDWIFVKQHPQTAYRKYAVLIGTIFENCDNKKVSFTWKIESNGR